MFKILFIGIRNKNQTGGNNFINKPSDSVRTGMLSVPLAIQISFSFISYLFQLISCSCNLNNISRELTAMNSKILQAIYENKNTN